MYCYRIVSVEEPVEEATVPAPGRKPTPKVTDSAHDTDTVTEPRNELEPIMRPKDTWRILEIDPDTIKSNE